MAETRKIKTALISVFHKDGLEELLAKLHEEGVKFLSTGGTQQFIESLGYACETVESITSYPSILGGRVKTLHPKIFGGILGRRDLAEDQAQMAQYEIPAIDLVVVDLYPFEQAEYSMLLHLLQQQGAETTIEERRKFAARAFAVSSHYDTAIHQWFVK